MDYTILFFLLILISTTTRTTSLHHDCNTDVNSLASGMADSQQLTTLQYCLIDNCTIIRIDTGQQLDIVYTTQSHLVVTPTDGQTSLLIVKNDPELFCSTPSTGYNTNQLQQIPILITLTISLLLSAFIAAVHLMFKQLRSTFGKLLIINNIATTIGCANSIALSITHYSIAVNSVRPCYLLWFLLMQSTMAREGSATCIIAYLAYIMHQSSKCRQVTREMNRNFFKRSVVYILGLLLLVNIFIVSYDFGTGSFKLVILPNGHCDYFNGLKYDTATIVSAFNALNKIIQIILLVVYFISYYKLNKMLRMVHDMVANTDQQQNRLFLKIAITMAVTIGMFYFTIMFNELVAQAAIIGTISTILLIQQCVIVILIACSKNVSQVCKEKFCTTGTSS